MRENIQVNENIKKYQTIEMMVSLEKGISVEECVRQERKRLFLEYTEDLKLFDTDVDFDKTINEVIEILRKKAEDIKKNVDLTYELKVYNACFENEYEQKLDKYSEVISSFDDNEKNEISGSMKFLIDKISSSLEEYTQSKKLEQFSSKLSEEIYKLLK